MIRPMESYNRARFEFYNRRMAEFGLKCGLAMKTMEDSFRDELLQQLSAFAKTNTAIANLLGKHEKTIRNLKRRQRERTETIEHQNRMFTVASLVHDRTWADTERWLSRDSILDLYYEEVPEDDLFDEESLGDVLDMLVREGTLEERRLQYSVFYRTSERSMARARVAETDEEALEIIAAITESFQASADSVADSPEALKTNKFTEWSAKVKSPKIAEEINQKLRDYAQKLIAEYEHDAANLPEDELTRLKVVSLVGAEVSS
jgi:hypothetical protein